MSLKKIDWQTYAFEDCRGNLRQIRGCPLLKLDELADLLQLLEREVTKDSGDNTLAELYQRNPFIRSLAHRCLELAAIDPLWVDINQMAQLLHPYEVSPGQWLPPLLIQLNFPREGSDSIDEGVTLKEYISDAIATLWQSEGSLEKALDLAVTVPADLLNAVLRSRAKQVSPKVQAEERANKLAARLAKSQTMNNQKPSSLKPPIDLSVPPVVAGEPKQS